MERRDDCVWSEAKNAQLQAERGLSFEAVMAAVEDGKVLADLRHPNQEQFAHQRTLAVEIDGYACAVPYVSENGVRFLKTIYRSPCLAAALSWIG